MSCEARLTPPGFNREETRSYFHSHFIVFKGLGKLGTDTALVGWTHGAIAWIERAYIWHGMAQHDIDGQMNLCTLFLRLSPPPCEPIPFTHSSASRRRSCLVLCADRPNQSSSGGLGLGGNMRFRTGVNLIDLTAEVSRRLEHVKFPFLIMHDPGDSE